ARTSDGAPGSSPAISSLTAIETPAASAPAIAAATMASGSRRASVRVVVMAGACPAILVIAPIKAWGCDDLVSSWPSQARCKRAVCGDEAPVQHSVTGCAQVRPLAASRVPRNGDLTATPTGGRQHERLRTDYRHPKGGGRRSGHLDECPRLPEQANGLDG